MTHKEHLKQLLAVGKIADAIKELLEATKLNGQEDLHRQVILQSGI